jgi:hypothetical protein
MAKPSDGLEPSTPPYHRGVTRVHARSSATRFSLQISPIRRRTMRREASRVSFLMCPFCVRLALLAEATYHRLGGGLSLPPLSGGLLPRSGTSV